MCQKKLTWVLRSSPPFNKKHFQDVFRPCVHPMCILNKKRACLVLVFLFFNTRLLCWDGKIYSLVAECSNMKQGFFRWCKQWSLEFMSAGCTARWLMFSIFPIVFFLFFQFKYPGHVSIEPLLKINVGAVPSLNPSTVWTNWMTFCRHFQMYSVEW